MTSDKLKWVVAGSVLLYLYIKWKEGNEDGTLAGLNIDSDKVVDSALPWLKINPYVKPIVGGVAKSFLRGVVGVPKHDVLEAEWKRV